MRDALIIGIACVAAIFLGAWLYFSGTGTNTSATQSGFTVLEKGMQSGSLTSRANYRIKSKEELDALWNLVYGSGGPAAAVDFTKEEVLAVFDGSHSSGGYDITVDSVKDEGGVRKIHITHTIPGEGCAVSSAITSPYQIVVVPRSSLPLSRTDATATADCR